MGLAIWYATSGIPKHFIGFIIMPIFSGSVAFVLEKKNVGEEVSG
jgi:hypothetical protein